MQHTQSKPKHTHAHHSSPFAGQLVKIALVPTPEHAQRYSRMDQRPYLPTETPWAEFDAESYAIYASGASAVVEVTLRNQPNFYPSLLWGDRVKVQVGGGRQPTVTPSPSIAEVERDAQFESSPIDRAVDLAHGILALTSEQSLTQAELLTGFYRAAIAAIPGLIAQDFISDLGSATRGELPPVAVVGDMLSWPLAEIFISLSLDREAEKIGSNQRYDTTVGEFRAGHSSDPRLTEIHRALVALEGTFGPVDWDAVYAQTRRLAVRVMSHLRGAMWLKELDWATVLKMHG
ncbi:hypothetical protein DM791_21910 [Paenarthrobacter nitroguajacolicus]|nr:hypothetical protein [Paenarthrobacter nitroguajacolicus]